MKKTIFIFLIIFELCTTAFAKKLEGGEITSAYYPFILETTTVTDAKLRIWMGALPDLIIYNDGTLIRTRDMNSKLSGYTGYKEFIIEQTKVDKIRLCNLLSVLNQKETIPFKAHGINLNDYTKFILTFGSNDQFKQESNLSKKDIILIKELVNEIASTSQYAPYNVQEVELLYIQATSEKLKKTKINPIRWPWQSVPLDKGLIEKGEVVIANQLIKGKIADRIYNFFNGKRGLDVIFKDKIYSVYIRPILPHEIFSEGKGAVEINRNYKSNENEIVCD